ncbi:hypothetical protein D9611_007162 [Ephemerocybe angulata]|uniref:Uncharacterized protein n=1 Tax=Ephemerocybe angulata TaxID=980116 RepID=A0A8H5EW72_9AGAR|nr:hypothetical protein D9611_007162 [Tulosesus angulatus]
MRKRASAEKREGKSLDVFVQQHCTAVESPSSLGTGIPCAACLSHPEKNKAKTRCEFIPSHGLPWLPPTLLLVSRQALPTTSYGQKVWPQRNQGQQGGSE